MPGLFEGFAAKYRKGLTFASLVLAAILCMLVSNRTFVIKPKEIGHSIVALFQSGVTGTFRWLSGTVNSITELRAARERLADAESRLAQANQVAREVVELRQQNEMLREQLGLARTIPFAQIGAEVIAKDHDNLSSTITINKGSLQGVRKGMPVVAFQGDLEGLVGKVVLAGLGSSQVLPLYDPACFVSARLDRSRYEGMVGGQGKDVELLEMKYVKKLAKDTIEYGDMVVTAGLGGLFPKDINIGRVRELNAQVYETSLEIFVEPLIDFDRLEYVFVLDVGQ